MGIEPTSSAWEAEVMAIIRRPQNGGLYREVGGEGKGDQAGARAGSFAVREVLVAGGGGEGGMIEARDILMEMS